MIIKWFVILTIGCLPIEEQPPGANCVIETTVVEAPVFDELAAKRIVKHFPADVMRGLPGSFVLARYEKRVAKEKKEEEK